MGLSTQVAMYLPQLRRFSRALTGSQQSGDAYVAAVLEALIAEPTALNQDSNIRVELYRIFCKWWESISLNLQSAPAGSEPSWIAAAQKRLSGMPPLAREAFLLMTVEGFSIDEISTVLGRTVSEVQSLVEEASNAIVEQVATNVMIKIGRAHV